MILSLNQIGPSGVRALPLGVATERSVHYIWYYSQAPALAGLSLALISISPHPPVKVGKLEI